MAGSQFCEGCEDNNFCLKGGGCYLKWLELQQYRQEEMERERHEIEEREQHTNH